MASAAAALLDELMGRNRNTDPNSDAAILKWDHQQVCKHFLCGYCPNELFTNTKADLGPCNLIHDDPLKKEYKESDKHEKMGYEERWIASLEDVIGDVDKKIKRGHQRLAMTQESEPSPQGSGPRQDQIKQLSSKIDDLVYKAEILGSEGKVEEAQGVMKLCDQLKKERYHLENLDSTKQDQITAQAKQMEVCPVCGAFLIVGDAESRQREHLLGKQHMGYAQMRATVDEFHEKRKAKRDAERAEQDKKREDERKKREEREKARRRSRSPDRRDRGRDRGDRDRGRSDRDRDRGDRDRDRGDRDRGDRGRGDRDRGDRDRGDRDRRDRDRGGRRGSSRDRRRSRSRDRRRSRSRDRDSRRRRSRSRDRRDKDSRRSRSRDRRSRDKDGDKRRSSDRNGDSKRSSRAGSREKDRDRSDRSKDRDRKREDSKDREDEGDNNKDSEINAIATTESMDTTTNGDITTTNGDVTTQNGDGGTDEHAASTDQTAEVTTEQQTEPETADV